MYVYYLLIIHTLYSFTKEIGKWAGMDFWRSQYCNVRKVNVVKVHNNAQPNTITCRET